MTTKPEKRKWFYTPFKNDTQAVVLLAHGLNLLPSKMDQLAHFFNSKKCDVLRLSLGSNPDLWSEVFNDEYDAALEHATILDRPLYFVGFSLGALLGLHFMVRHPHHQISKMALFAPATHTRIYTRLPAFLSYIAPKLSLPSFNLENYRAHKRTSLREYKTMHVLQSVFKKEKSLELINIPTLLITSPKDEFVDSQQLTKFAQGLSLWKTLEISNHDSQLPKKYHHLMIDSESLGGKEWQKVLQNLTDLLTL